MKLDFINENKNVSERLRESHTKLSKTNIADVLISILVFNEYQYAIKFARIFVHGCCSSWVKYVAKKEQRGKNRNKSHKTLTYM